MALVRRRELLASWGSPNPKTQMPRRAPGSGAVRRSSDPGASGWVSALSGEVEESVQAAHQSDRGRPRRGASAHASDLRPARELAARPSYDTHVLVWWYLDSPELPQPFRAALERLEKDGERAGVCSISLWEIAKLVERGRLQLTLTVDELLEQIEAGALFQVLPLTGRVAAESTRLGPSFNKDPADQLIAATARCYGLRLMTCDEAVRRSNAVALFS